MRDRSPSWAVSVSSCWVLPPCSPASSPIPASRMPFNDSDARIFSGRFPDWMARPASMSSPTYFLALCLDSLIWYAASFSVMDLVESNISSWITPYSIETAFADRPCFRSSWSQTARPLSSWSTLTSSSSIDQLVLGLPDESEDGVHEEREFATVQLVLRLHECLVVGVLVLRDGAGQRQHGGHG